MSDHVALVLAGGGARGAYEVGALAELLPALHGRGERPTIVTGTSVGAINAAYVASTAHLDVEDQVAGAIERWREIEKQAVMSPILFKQMPLTAIRYAGEILNVPGMQVPGLLDPAPLQRSLRCWVDFGHLRRNIDAGVIQAVCVFATAARSGNTVGFLDGKPPRRPHRSHAVRYVRARLEGTHVRASAAIPIFFPAVWVERPPQARGWYYDGGTRLNTPIKPALDLGATKIVVVGMESLAEHEQAYDDVRGERPDFGDGTLNVLHGLLADPVMEDMRTLANINTFLVDGGANSGAVRYRKARGKPPYRTIEYAFVCPGRPGAIGELALETFERRYGGLRALRDIDIPLLSRLLGGNSATHGELLSYLLFDSEFASKLIELGRKDAKRWLRRHAGDGGRGLWCSDPMHDLLPSRRKAAR